MEATIVGQLASHGGFALLAAVALYLLFKSSEARAADLKESAERERVAREEANALTQTCLSHIKESAGVMASLNTTLAAIFSIRKLDETWPGMGQKGTPA